MPRQEQWLLDSIRPGPHPGRKVLLPILVAGVACLSTLAFLRTVSCATGSLFCPIAPVVLPITAPAATRLSDAATPALAAASRLQGFTASLDWASAERASQESIVTAAVAARAALGTAAGHPLTDGEWTQATVAGSVAASVALLLGIAYVVAYYVNHRAAPGEYMFSMTDRGEMALQWAVKAPAEASRGSSSA
eukprot:EG_transcript_19305